jgi:hypothetical protein
MRTKSTTKAPRTFVVDQGPNWQISYNREDGYTLTMWGGIVGSYETAIEARADKEYFIREHVRREIIAEARQAA